MSSLTGSFSRSLKAGDCVFSDRFSFQQLSLQVFVLWSPEVFAASRKHLQDFRGDVAHGFDHPDRKRKQPTVSFLTGSFSSSLAFRVCFFWQHKSAVSRCRADVVWSFGLRASLFWRHETNSTVSIFLAPASVMTLVLQAFVLVFSGGNPPHWPRCDLPGSKALGQIDR